MAFNYLYDRHFYVRRTVDLIKQAQVITQIYLERLSLILYIKPITVSKYIILMIFKRQKDIPIYWKYGRNMKMVDCQRALKTSA